MTALAIRSGEWTGPRSLPPRTTAFLALSALATGASWVCHSRTLQLGQASQVAPVDKFSVALATCGVALFAFVPRTHRKSAAASRAMRGVDSRVQSPLVAASAPDQ